MHSGLKSEKKCNFGKDFGFFFRRESTRRGSIIVQLLTHSTGGPQTVRFHLTRFFSGPKMCVRRGPPIGTSDGVDIRLSKLNQTIFRASESDFSRSNIYPNRIRP